MKRRAAYVIGLILTLGAGSARANDAVPMLDESCRLSPTAGCLLAQARSQATEKKFRDIEGLRHIAKIEERMGDTAAAVSTLTDIINGSAGTRRDIADLVRLAGPEVALKSVAKLDADFRQKFGQPQAPSNRALWVTASDLAASYVMVGNIPAALDLLEQQGRDDEFRASVASAIFDKLPANAENHVILLRLADVMNKRERPGVAAVLAYLELGEIDKAIALTREDPGLIMNARRWILEKGLDVEAVALIKAMPDSHARESEYQDLAKAFLEKGDKVRAGRVLAAAFADYDLPGRIRAAQNVTYRSVKETWRLSSLTALVDRMVNAGVADTAAPSLQAAYRDAMATEDPTIRFLLIAPIAAALGKVSDERRSTSIKRVNWLAAIPRFSLGVVKAWFSALNSDLLRRL